MKKRSTTAVLLLILIDILLLSGGCSKNNENEISINRVEMPMAKPGSGGVSFGLYNVNGNIEKTKIFKIEKGQKFSKIISISNYINHSRKYLLLTLVDCIQVTFLVGGTEYTTYTFSMDANEVTEIPVSVDSLNEGFHDVIFVIFKSPEITMESKDLGLANSLDEIYPLRCNVIVGCGNVFTPALSETHPIRTINNSDIHGIFISNSPEVMKVWYTEKTHNTEIPYYIHIGNQDAEPHNYAVISFLDWHQVSVNENEKVLYLTLKPNEKRVYRGLLRIPLGTNRNKLNFTSLCISEPLSLLTKEQGQIEPSLRTTIILQ